MEKLYLFSGLGADEKFFQGLDFQHFTPIFIKWEVPDGKETIEEYATRLLDQITMPRPILIGLSFGGIMAVEVAKQIETEKVVLISSAKTKKEIPFYYRFAGSLGLHQQTLIETEPAFLKWAIDKVAHWANETLIPGIFHIHGARDRILPLRFVDCDQTIKNGGHLMVLNKSEELNKILKMIIGDGIGSGSVINSNAEGNSIDSTQYELCSRINEQRLDSAIEKLKSGESAVKNLLGE